MATNQLPARREASSIEIPRTTYPARKRRRGGQLSDETVHTLVKRLIDDARNFNDNDLAPMREKCWRYYNGAVDNKPRKGRSKAVDRVVRDTVDGILPQLMKVFTSSQTVARYIADVPDAQEMADQATRYAHHVFIKQNQGFRQLHDHLKDGLVGGLGVLRVYCAHDVETTEERYEGLTPDEFTMLVDDGGDDVEILEVAQMLAPATPSVPSAAASDEEPGVAAGAGASGAVTPLTGGPPSAMPSPPPAMPSAGASPPDAGAAAAPASGGAQIIPFRSGSLTAPAPSVLINCTIRRTHTDKRLVIDTIDPAEFLIDRRATSEDDAAIIGMDSTRPISDVVAMGIDPKEFDDVETAIEVDQTGEKQARRPSTPVAGVDQQPDDPALDRPVRIVDVVVRIDQDGDGVAERRHIVALGAQLKIVRNEPTDEVPYAVGSPVLVPHSAVGQGVGELVVDLQDIQTAILRQQLDSLYQAVNPRTIVVEQQVTLQDVVDPQFNGVIRCRAPGMVQPYTVDFVGQQAFPMVERLDKIKENRTGFSAASQGLDADALQSSTEVGVRAVLGAALQKIELFARIYAETSLQRLFRMILFLAVRYQQEPMTIDCEGEPFFVDPRSWQADMRVDVEVGLGTGNDDERRNALMFVLAKQEQIMLNLGPANPLCTLIEYQNALADFLKITPYKDVTRYFKEVTPQALQALQQQMAQQSQDQGAAQLAKVQMAKVQADMQAKQAKTQMDAQAKQQEMALKREGQQQDMQLRVQETQANVELERLKAMGDLQVKQQELAAETQQGIVELQAETALEKYKVDEQVKVDTRLKKPE